MKVAGIVAEYNPFHSGHLYQISKIREEFGEGTAIIAIMSGNYTQRAEVAFCGKDIRARGAVDCGVNLVLELPFPYCSSSAEIFAESGVCIADALGIVDYLSFGSECGDAKKIKACAEIMLTAEYALLRDSIYSGDSVGYAEACERAYLKLLKDPTASIPFTSNNILAIEYTKAILKRKSNIKIHTVKRVGAAYNDTDLDKGGLSSATAIRRAFSSDLRSPELLGSLPKKSAKASLMPWSEATFPRILKKFLLHLFHSYD